jgi:hypothetical protein
MPFQLRGIPRFALFFSSRSPTRTEAPTRTAFRSAGRLHGLIALALASLASACGGSAMAQPAVSPEERAVPGAPAEPVTTSSAETPGKPLFDPSQDWDASEPWRTDRFYFQYAYYTLHFHYDPAHQQSYLFDSEYHFQETWLGGQWIAGVALFQNSFGQFSEYVFGGLQWRPIEDHQPFYVKLTAGPLHGYEGQYKNKLPYNNSGVAPAVIPGIGYCVKRYCGEFVLLGANAALFTIGVTIP